MFFVDGELRVGECCMCRRNKYKKSKVFAQFEAAKAGGADEKEAG